jgi:hypothetical protein
VGSRALRERGSERLWSVVCRFRSAGEHSGLADGRERGSRGRERGSKRGSRTLPLEARFGVRTVGGGRVQKP